MQTTILRDPDAIRALEAAWRSLRPPTPFLAWSHLDAWLSQTDRKALPFIILVSDEQGWAAIAAWCIQRDGLGIRRVTGIGGEDAWYHDPWLIRPEKEEAIAEALAAALLEARRDWDMLGLVLRDESSAPILGQLRKLGMSYAERVDWRQHQTASLGEDWEAYWNARPKQVRELVRRRGKKLEALEHRFREADLETLDPLLDGLFGLHQARWKSERDWSAYYRSVRALAHEALERGELCFYALEAEGRMLAYELLIRCGARSFELMRIVDPSPAYASLSAGSLLTAWALERMQGAGVREVDLGPGQHEWKAGLQTHRTSTFSLAVARPGRAVALARLSWNGLLRPALKGLPLAQQLKAVLKGAGRRESKAVPAS